MGVMPCARTMCTAILCRRLVLDEYLCEECFAELCALKENWEPGTMTKSEMRERIEDFFDTVPGGIQKLDREGIEQAFKELTVTPSEED